MKMTLINLLGVFLILSTCHSTNKNSFPINEIDSFDKCYLAGGNIMESHPRQCVINDKHFTEVLGPNKKGAFVTRHFKVEAKKQTCQGLHPVDQKCLIVNGGIFYDNIKGFQHEEGTEYILEVKQTQICDPEVLNDCPQDISIYNYELIRTIHLSK